MKDIFFVTKSSNLFYSVKLGSVEVPCGGLELLKWGKTALGKKLEEVISHEKQQHASQSMASM